MKVWTQRTWSLNEPSTRYVRQQLGGTGEADTEALKTENDDLRKKIVELQERVDELTAEPK